MKKQSIRLSFLLTLLKKLKFYSISLNDDSKIENVLH